eukprot:gnl/TRDRNA2_/TRDRNA2_128564_c0_seq1.p1 gnl/TRDRNA2_/TRDRNA2_128564_c0~~gnl/TRDRNA2_/TRDRNA2_128564_c0_seq1.p1  ORF type:complete len:516 (-),score=59.99 gnl/TRDRNA2_/TRDRNA2_128564_c0_seq1:231-1778(-)
MLVAFSRRYRHHNLPALAFFRHTTPLDVMQSSIVGPRRCAAGVPRRIRNRHYRDAVIPIFELRADTSQDEQPIRPQDLHVKRVPLADLLESSRVQGDSGHVSAWVDTRDILALGITPDGSLESSHTPPCILPRHGCILVALGRVRAIIRPDVAYILGAHHEDVAAATISVASGVGVDSNSERLQKGDSAQDPFELQVLEATLDMNVRSIEAKVELMSSLATAVIHRIQVSHANEVLDGVARCQPVLEQLGHLEIDVRELDDCIADIMKSNKDMSDMLLTAHAEGRPIDCNSEDHDEVELVLEACHRRLHRSLLLIQEHAKKLRFALLLGDVKLAAYRSRLDRVNINVSLGGVCLAISASVAGFFGMNVPVPFAENVVAFPVIVAGCAGAAGMIYAHVWSKYLGSAAGKHERHRADIAIASRRVLKNIEQIHEVLEESGALKQPAVIDGDRNLQMRIAEILARPVSDADLQCMREIIAAINDQESPEPSSKLKFQDVLGVMTGRLENSKKSNSGSA